MLQGDVASPSSNPPLSMSGTIAAAGSPPPSGLGCAPRQVGDGVAAVLVVVVLDDVVAEELGDSDDEDPEAGWLVPAVDAVEDVLGTRLLEDSAALLGCGCIGILRLTLTLRLGRRVEYRGACPSAI